MTIATALQALQQAKTNIASAITQRGGTVNSGDGFSDFAACVATIPQGSSAPSTPVNFEVHKVKVSTKLTGSGQTLLSGVQFIKDHFNDPGFMVIIMPVTTLPTGTAGVGFAQRGNRPICEKIGGGGYYYGVKTGSNGTSVSNQNSGNPLTTAEWNGFPSVDSTGRFYVNCNTTSGSYPAGDYLIMLAVMEE